MSMFGLDQCLYFGTSPLKDAYVSTHYSKFGIYFHPLYSPSDALEAAFTRTDEQFRRELDARRMRRRGGGKDWHPGCTAVAALVTDAKLVVANAGDCRAVLCRKGKAVQITKVGACRFCGSLLSAAFRCFDFDC